MVPRGENRAKLIGAMRDLALTKGYSATTVDEVCEAAEVSKGSFYHHFGTKEDIGHAALDQHFDELMAAITDPTDLDAETEPSATVRLRTFLDRATTICGGPMLAKGCVLGSFALDLAETHPTVQERLDQHFTVLSNYVSVLIDAAGREAGVPLPSAALARQFLALIEGSIVLAKSHNDRQILPASLELFTQHINLLLDQGDQNR